MAEGNSIYADVSTFPRASATPYDPLGTIGKLQGLEQQQIGIDQSKLRLVNEKWGLNSKVLAELQMKGQHQLLSGKDLQSAYKQMYEHGGMNEDQYAQSVSSISTPTTLKRKYPNATPEQLSQLEHQEISNRTNDEQVKGLSTMEAINAVHGAPSGFVDTGQTMRSVSQSPYRGTFEKGDVFQKRIPVTTPTAGQAGPQAYGEKPDIQPIQPNRLRTVPAPSLPTNLGPGEGSPAYVNPRTNATGQPNNLTGPQTPTGPMLGQPYGFDEGLKQYSTASERAGNTLQAVKPAQQALQLMDPEVIKGLTGTGPIAAKASQVLGALQGVGILKSTEPVAQRQELVKYLAQYLRNSPSAQRSDSAQALADKASANPDAQNLEALVKITRQNIANDRVEAAKSLSFQRGVENKQYQKFQEHQANFPNTVDSRAFMLDSMTDKEANALIDRVEKTESPAKVKKFLESYQLAKTLGML